MCSLLLVASPGLAEADEASVVRVERGPGLPAESVAFSLVALSERGGVPSFSDVGPSPLRLESPEWVGELSVPDGTCLIARGPAAWSRPACPTSEGYRLELLPGVAFRLRWQEDDRRPEPLPDALVVHAWERRLEEEVPLSCRRERDQDVWSCAGPAEPFDLRVDLPGFAPVFAWNVEVDPREPAEALVIPLARGASVDGWVDGPAGVARLAPAGRWTENLEERLRFATRESSFGPDGHFRFAHVGVGAYRLEVESPGRAPHRSTVEIRESDEEVVLQDISLSTLRQVDLSVSPALDGFGERWRVQLSRVGETSRPAGELTLDWTGWGELSDLELGRYLLVVTDSRDSVWHLGWHEIDESASLVVDIPRVLLEGSITSGGEPVRTSLVFGTTQGSNRIVLESDERGRFEGFLPREGRWEVEMGSSEAGCATCEGTLGVVLIPPVDVEVGPSGKAFVDIRLPDTELRGRVVRLSGADAPVPVPGAQILMLRVEGDRARRGRKVQVWAEDDGTFSVQGLEPGPLRVAALLPGGRGESDWAQVDLREGATPPELELVIRDKVPLTVFVGAAGAPVAGARILALPRDGVSVNGVTDLDGRATLRVPAGSVGALLVEPVGRGVWLGGFAGGEAAEAGGPPTAEVRVDVGQPPGELSVRGVSAVPAPAWLVAEGAAVALQAIRSFLPGLMEVSDGRFVLKNLAPGRYSLCLWARERCLEVTVPPGGRADLERAAWEEQEGGA